MGNKELLRQMYEKELIHLKLNYEKEFIDLMSKNKEVLTFKEKSILKKLKKKANAYPIIGITNSIYKYSINTIDINKSPFSFLWELDIPEQQIDFYNSLLSRSEVPCNIILKLIKKIITDGFEVGDYRLIYNQCLSNDDCFFVFKNVKKGMEFYALYNDNFDQCEFGYCDKDNGEKFDANFSVSFCIEKYDKNYTFSPIT